jgi:cytokinin dehydrogenase
MTVVAPLAGADMFYTVGLLRSAVVAGDLKLLERENEEVLAFCDKEGIECKQYLPHHMCQDGWQQHFGERWTKIADLKAKFDPHAILSSSQRIF